MQLPGGIEVAGRLRKDFRFRPVDGEMELSLAESLDGEAGVATRVTLALSAALTAVGGEPADERLIGALSVGDRQFLMRQLAAHLGQGSQWLSAACRGCGERFDFSLEHHRLPVKPAGEGFPLVKVSTSLGEAVLHVPSGDDQDAILDLIEIEGAEAAQEALVQRCLKTLDDLACSHAPFTGDDVQAIDQALEAVSPEVTTELEAACPHCGHQQRVYIDPYQAVSGDGFGSASLFSEIHSLAWHYHWSEAEILAMPRARRQRYLRLIDRSRGMSTETPA